MGKSAYQHFIKKGFDFDEKVFGFTAFSVLSLLYVWFKQQGIELNEFSNHLVGQAAFEKIDIRDRVNLYYQALGIVSGLFLLIYPVLSTIKSRLPSGDTLFYYLRNTGIGGLFMLFFSLMEVSNPIMFDLMWVLSLKVLLFYGLSFFKGFSLGNKHQFFWLLLLAVAFTFLARELMLVLAFINTGIPHFHWLFIVLVPFTYGLVLLMAKQFQVNIPAAAKLLRPVLFLPLLTFLSDELYLITTQWGITVLSPFAWYSGMGVLLLIWFVQRWRKHKNYPYFSLRNENFKVGFPVLLASIGLIAHYEPIINQPKDLFELANPANAIMRFYEFGEVPILEALSSHLLSEQVFEFLYTVLNGYNGSLDFLIYSFGKQVLFVLIFYYFFKTLLNNGYLAFILALVFPFYDTLVPPAHSLALLSIPLAYSVFVNRRLKDFLIMAGWSAFLVIWRIDLGYANMVAILLLFLIYLGWHFEKSLFLKAGKAIINIGLLLIAILLIIASIKDINFFLNAQKALSYFGAHQAHGLVQLTPERDALFYYHYFLFPALILFICGGIGFFTLKKRTWSKQTALLVTAILYLAFYYFTNASRGLVRHSFIEQNDVFISSFFFLIISLTVVLVLKEKGMRYNLGFLLVTALTIQVFSYPDSKDQLPLYNKFNKAFKKDNSKNFQEADLGNNRMKQNRNFAENHYSGFKTFMDTNFSSNATFIDLSNTPMLYFYTKRPVPSYFNQYMQNTVTEFLQVQNLKYLQQFDVPVTVFSHYPRTWFDHTDGVPNTIRYNLIANYVYKHYEPYRLIDDYYVWKKPSLNSLKPKGQMVDSAIKFGMQEFNLKQYPYVLGNYHQLSKPEVLQIWEMEKGQEQERINSYKFDLKADFNPYLNYLKIEVRTVQGSKPLKANLSYYEGNQKLGSYNFKILKEGGVREYCIPLSNQYNWLARDANRISVDLESSDKVKLERFSLIRETHFDALLSN